MLFLLVAYVRISVIFSYIEVYYFYLTQKGITINLH